MAPILRVGQGSIPICLFNIFYREKNVTHAKIHSLRLQSVGGANSSILTNNHENGLLATVLQVDPIPSFIRFRSEKSEHTPADPLVWRRNVSGAFLRFTQSGIQGQQGAWPCPLRVHFVANERRALRQLLKYIMHDVIASSRSKPPRSTVCVLYDLEKVCWRCSRQETRWYRCLRHPTPRTILQCCCLLLAIDRSRLVDTVRDCSGYHLDG